MVKVVHLLPLLSLIGCASIIEGTSQEMMVNTTPEAASCTVTQNGLAVGKVSRTPSTIKLEKTKYDITITCTKAGYETATYFNDSGVEPWVFGNLLIGGLIGWGIDSSLGADNKYESPVNIMLAKK